MITLDMLKKSAPVRISIGHFSTENNIVLLPIKLMSGEADYNLEGKTVTASFEGKPMTAPLEIVEGVIQLQVTNDLLSIGENRIQLALNWPGNKQELSPIMLWRILSPIVPGTEPGSVDILSSLINQTNEAISKETEREEAEINRNVYEAFDPLKAYKVNNKVSYQGSSYICTAETTEGTLPTNETYWMLIASKGEKGDEGLSAYEVWIAEGNVGTMDDYLASLKGVKGDPGPAGGNVILDDAVAATNKVWSSSKVSAQLAEKVQNFKMVNFILNGNFAIDTNSDGMADNFTQGTGNTGSIVNNKQRATVNGTTATSAQIMQIQTPLTVGNKYYVKFEAETNNVGVNRAFICGQSVVNPFVNGFNSGILNLTSSPTPTNRVFEISVIKSGFPVLPSGTYVEISKLLEINLTSLFGAGNEPTKEEMDRLVSMVPNQWWDGELDLTQQQYVNWLLSFIREKANKAQEDWITPTFLNGATGTLQYRKNNFNELMFKGDVTTPNIAFSVLMLPVSYRPAVNKYCAGSSETTYQRIVIGASGNILVATNNTKTFLDGIIIPLP